MQSLPAQDCWNCRHMCGTWASAARRTACFAVMVPVTPQNVLSELQALNKRRLATAYQALQFRLTLTEPVSCPGLLQELKLQTQKGACTKGVYLDVDLAGSCREAEIIRLAAKIAHSYQKVSGHDIRVCLKISHVPSCAAPTAAVLELLALFVDLWDDIAMKGGLVDDLEESMLKLRPCLTSRLGVALLMATSLQSLCVCLEGPSAAANSTTAAIATLCSLKRLHLAVPPDADLGPLVQLRSLEDFALKRMAMDLMKLLNFHAYMRYAAAETLCKRCSCILLEMLMTFFSPCKACHTCRQSCCNCQH